MFTDDRQFNPKIVISVMILVIAFVALSCKECPTEPGPVHYQTVLAVDYAGPSFVSLYFSISDSGQSRQYAIRRDTSIILSGRLKGADTVVTDWQAEPATSYCYQLMITKNGKTLDTSRSVTTITMDTTSHEFSWEVDTLGENGTLYDVWAFSENNVWAVGFVYPKWGETEVHNGYRWDGSKWNINDLISNYWKVDIRSFYAFSQNDIWANSTYPQHGDGETFYLYHLYDMGLDVHPILDCWGTDSNQMYFVGREGTIVHYDGQNFTRMASPTDRDLLNIDGCVDRQSGQIRAWAGGWSYSERGSFIAMKAEEWDLVFDEDHPFYLDPYYINVHGIFVPNDKIVIMIVAGLSGEIMAFHHQKYFDDCQSVSIDPIMGATWAIDGNSLNDFFIVGDNRIIHYNGYSISIEDEVCRDLRLRGIYQNGNSVYIVGEALSSQHAIAIRGVRK